MKPVLLTNQQTSVLLIRDKQIIDGKNSQNLQISTKFKQTIHHQGQIMTQKKFLTHLSFAHLPPCTRRILLVSLTIASEGEMGYGGLSVVTLNGMEKLKNIGENKIVNTNFIKFPN